MVLSDEYKGLELAVDADASLFKKDYIGKAILSKGKERLYSIVKDIQKSLQVTLEDRYPLLSDPETTTN